MNKEEFWKAMSEPVEKNCNTCVYGNGCNYRNICTDTDDPNGHRGVTKNRLYIRELGLDTNIEDQWKLMWRYR